MNPDVDLQKNHKEPRRQSVPPMAFSSGSDTVDPGMRRLSMVEYMNQQPSGSLSQFTFDPSMNPNFAQSMNNQYSNQMPEMEPKDISMTGLSVNTQYPSAMAFGQLSATSDVFPSPYDTDFNNPFPDNPGNMGLDMNTMMSDADISRMNDMFSAQQFGSPTFTAPMNGTFDNTVYGQQQSIGGENMENGAQLDTILTSTASRDFQMMPITTQASSYSQAAPLTTVTVSSAIASTADKRPATTSTASTKTKSSQPPKMSTIGGLSLPWSEPEGGWPSTMLGAKPHMETNQYRDIYAPSGYNLLDTLFRVHTRKNPQIQIGAVDLSCAFVVCDARSHDNPIIYCSDSFERLTGYNKYEIIGQNCRFLQSPDGKVESGVKRKYCDDDSVLYLKNSITTRTEAQISLINYRKGGQPFMNLLTMIPLLDGNGEALQFVGFQVDLVENPTAVSARNPDGTYSMNYQRNPNLQAYTLAPPDPATIMDQGQSISRDEVSTILSTLGSSDNDYSKRMVEKMILENSDDVIHVLSLKGLFLYLSPACGKVLEYDPSELVGTALSSVCHPSDIVPVTRELKDTQSGSSVSVVFRIRRKQNGYVWFESHGCLHTDHGKGKKCIILVGRTRPVYTLSKAIIMTAGGIGDHEMWSKLSTTGMFLYVSSHVKGLLDKHPDELMGTNMQNIMRAESKAEFDRILTLVLTGKSASLRHEAINRRGQVLQAHTWLYPGDAVEGQKPTFVIGQTRLIKYQRSISRPSLAGLKVESMRSTGSVTSHGRSVDGPSLGSSTPVSMSSTIMNDKFRTTTGVIVSRAGALATPLGHQDESLASEENAFDELKTTKSSSWQFELRQLERRNRVLAEEVQQLLASKKKRKRRRGAGMMQKDCANCHTISTPEWRRGPSGNRDLCNSCGLRWAKQQGRLSPRTSDRHTVSQADGSQASKDSESPASHNFHSPLNTMKEATETATLKRDTSSTSLATTKSITPNSATPTTGHSSVPDKRNTSQDRTPEPVSQKSQRMNIPSGLPHRIQELEEPTEKR
ncbi:hypothetical protein BT63DRAFT_433883 [Microthyrium microscopicum]|uniref:White collar n=1 Tax=Microthyrium microscopicum TaxID=703497 RepID=A0A6A6U4W5_9PEZI|nr:hypothetical protein BT63DRAFT_433883 [Microthyrium microscopicum]